LTLASCAKRDYFYCVSINVEKSSLLYVGGGCNGSAYFPDPVLTGKDAQAFIDQMNNMDKRPTPAPVNPAKVLENIRRVRDEKKLF